MIEPIRLFIGFDQVEAAAYHTMVQSIIENTNHPVAITPIKRSMLPFFKREVARIAVISVSVAVRQSPAMF